MLFCYFIIFFTIHYLYRGKYTLVWVQNVKKYFILKPQNTIIYLHLKVVLWLVETIKTYWNFAVH